MASKLPLPTIQGCAKRVLRLLCRAYPFSRLGNKRNPLDELFFILLTSQTTGRPSQRAYARLRRAFRPWGRLLGASEDEIASKIHEAGLYRQRAKAIREIAHASAAQFGSVTLSPLKRMSRQEAERFLCSLPRIGLKSARCVLGYSLGHDTMPLDTHCLRVMRRLGLVQSRGSGERLHDAAEAIFPAGTRLRAHVAMVMHGRTRCYASHPKCEGCPVSQWCSYYSQHQLAKESA